MKPDMGIFAIRSKADGKCYIETARDLKGAVNRNRFQLEAGSHPIRELQKEWKDLGASNFTVQVLENLEYDKDESKTDYSEELALLRMIWEERLAKESAEFYK